MLKLPYGVIIGMDSLTILLHNERSFYGGCVMMSQNHDSRKFDHQRVVNNYNGGTKTYLLVPTGRAVSDCVRCCVSVCVQFSVV